MNRSLTGLEICSDENKLVKSDMLNYAHATRDRMELYEKDDFYAPPFFVCALAYPMMIKIITHPLLRMNLLRMIHAEQEIIWHRQIKTDEAVQIKVLIKDIYSISSGEIIQINGLALCNGIIAAEAKLALMVRGRRKPGHKPIENKSTSNELARYSFTTSEGQQLEYARAAGDTNLIHTSNLVARLAGLPRTIMQGICIMAMTANSLRDRLINGDAAHMKRMKCRFSRPALPGQTFTIVIEGPERENQAVFTVLNDAGEYVIKDGVFEYSVQ